MKKTVALTLIFLLLFTTVGCTSRRENSDYPPVYEAFIKMRDAYADSTSQEFEVLTTIQIEIQEEELMVTQTALSQQVVQDGEIEYHLQRNTNYLNEMDTENNYYKNGVFYNQTPSFSYQLDIPFSQVIADLHIGPYPEINESMISESNVEKNSDETLTYSISYVHPTEKGGQQEITALLENTVAPLSDFTIEPGSLESSYQFQVDGKGLPVRSILTHHLKLQNNVGTWATMEIQQEITHIQLNSGTSIVFPEDLSSYHSLTQNPITMDKQDDVA